MELTKREKEVLDLISKGYSKPEIAEKLCVSTHTVKAHTSSILYKIRVKNRVQATRLYISKFN